MEGMAGLSSAESQASNETKNNDFASDFTYCTEFIITRKNTKSLEVIRRFLGEIGDCPAAAEHSGIIKIHVHTNSPHLALQKGLEYGELSKIKIDNMRLQATASGK